MTIKQQIDEILKKHEYAFEYVHLDDTGLKIDSEFKGQIQREFNKDYTEKMAALLRAFSEAVIVLPDDAEPQVGDYVQAERLIGIVTKIENEFLEVKPTWAQYNCQFVLKEKWKIIQRNGKPVIYESELKKLMEKTSG